ncbi:hypothetical protein EGR_09062 [Echinococcus granulosus]|uniref:Uncharacterized protein n=1 Tax=Echinococcus granulosus TaxID=6210 RepID=W6UCQ4_ECHGR|nr:hypothetical protein EGR_09062 [Echinococcus granulosus]EUB56072.1 hypothetical protein EGR_09062 [Echinococcus granulosus]
MHAIPMLRVVNHCCDFNSKATGECPIVLLFVAVYAAADVLAMQIVEYYEGGCVSHCDWHTELRGEMPVSEEKSLAISYPFWKR